MPLRCFPALHGAHRALPSTAVLRPAGHVVQAVALIALAKVSWPQGLHRSWPVRLLNVPGMHGRQYARSVLSWWNPRGQFLQVWVVSGV